MGGAPCTHACIQTCNEEVQITTKLGSWRPTKKTTQTCKNEKNVWSSKKLHLAQFTSYAIY